MIDNEGVNTLCHVEIQALDLDRAQSFYEGLFGWTFRDFMGGSMRVFASGDVHIGGLMKVDKVEAGRSPSLWFQVASLDQTIAEALKLGGTKLEEKQEVPGVGWSILLADLDGTPFGLVEYTESAG